MIKYDKLIYKVCRKLEQNNLNGVANFTFFNNIIKRKNDIQASIQKIYEFTF